MYNGPHRKKLRQENWDYSQNGFYFVTICCYKNQCFFGEIINGKMILNEYGEIVKECLEQIPQHYPKSKIDKYIIMPNHIHLIIIINNESVGNENFHSLLGIFVQKKYKSENGFFWELEYSRGR